jgi:hypothetical protein
VLVNFYKPIWCNIPEDSHLHIHKFATGSYPEPDESNTSNPMFLRSTLISSHILLGLVKWSLPFRLSNQNFVCVSHLPHECSYTFIQGMQKNKFQDLNKPWWYLRCGVIWLFLIFLIICGTSPSAPL